MLDPNPLFRTLKHARASGRMALCGYFLTGYPVPDEFFRLVRAARALDVFEFGVPCARPALDGPVITGAHEVARQHGVGAETALALLGGLRHLAQPRLVMAYDQTVRDLPDFLRRCVENDIHGVLVPDIAPKEGRRMKMVADALNLAVLTLIDARASDETLRQRLTLGNVVYLKAGGGRTGEPAELEGKLGEVVADAIRRIRRISPEMPVAVGIGLQKPQQVAALARLDADMAVVGTKLVEKIQLGERALVDYIGALRAATPYPSE